MASHRDVANAENAGAIFGQKKVPKENGTPCRVDPAFLGFERGFSKGHPSPYEKRDASLHRPCGLIRPNPPVLGAALGDNTLLEI
jgi:hypothetical protein